MAYPGKIIANPRIGQDIRFIQTSKDTSGKLLEMESVYNTRSKEPVPHYHPLQAEDFTVTEGELTVRIGGTLKKLKKGDHLHIPANTIHSMWNDSTQRTVVNWKVQPAGETEYFLETACGLASSGKTNVDGIPSLLQFALMGLRFKNDFRIAKPPYAIQMILFSILSPIARLRGMRGIYHDYID
jgi:quercetin dioxygenase-like cupin family protein